MLNAVQGTLVHKGLRYINKMGNLRSELLRELESRGPGGLRQNEIYSALNYSRSHVSETLASLERGGIILRKREGKASKRVWLTEQYPGHIEGLVRVGILMSSEYVPFLSSIWKSMEGKNQKIKVRVFGSAPDLISSLHEYTLEIGVAPTFTHVLFSLTNKKEVIISAVGSGGSAVLSNSAVNNNLLATSESSTMALMSRELVKEKGAKIHFFTDPGKAKDEFLAGSFEYMAIWEPFLSDARNHPGIEEVSDSGEKSFLNPCCSIGVSRNFLESEGELVRVISRGYHEFLEKMGEPDLDYGIGVISDATGYNPEELLESLKSYEFSDRLDLAMLRKYMIDVGIPVSSERLKEMLL